MLDILAAIGLGGAIGMVSRALKDGCVINPGRHMPDTLDAISKRNDHVLEGIQWRESEVREGTYNCFDKGE